MKRVVSLAPALIPRGFLNQLGFAMWTPTTRQQHSRPVTRYQTDLTDAEWRVIAPHLPKPCATGRPRAWPMREIVNGIFYVMRAGCPWRLLPNDLPPWGTIYRWFAAWRDDGCFERINHALVMADRERFSPEEVARFLEAAPGVKYKAAFSVAYGAGLRVSEVAALKVSDIDSERMMLRVEQGKGRKDRYAMLSPVLLELLRDWWRIAHPKAWLFTGQDPLQPISTRQLNRACHAAAHMAEMASSPIVEAARASAQAIRSLQTSGAPDDVGLRLATSQYEHRAEGGAGLCPNFPFNSRRRRCPGSSSK